MATIYYNGTFISCETNNRIFSVLITEADKIVFTGNEIPNRFKDSKRINMNGRCVIPAFSDTHIHFESFALFATTADVREAKNFEDMGNILNAYIDTHPEAEFFPAYGCSAHTVEEKRLPERNDLDKMVSIPLLIVKYDGHAAVANSALIDAFPDEVTDDEGFDKETGWLYQNAFYKAVNFITAKVSPITLLKGMYEAADTLAGRGIGYIHTVEGVGYKNDIDIDTIQLIHSALPQKFTVFFQTMDTQKVVHRKMKHIGGCFRLALDGCFGSEDAALTQGYTNNPDNKGFLAYSQAEVDNFCIAANRAGLQIAMHAIGDAAVAQALHGFEAALKDMPRTDVRHILIHGDLMSEDAIKKAAQLHITIAVQPAFLHWREEPESYLTSILGERAKQILPLRSMVDNGLLVTSGSDGPCTVPNPIFGIYAACNHPDKAQSLTPLEALKTYTLWAAQSAGDDDLYGSLTAGKKANFVVLNKNILEVPKEEIKDIKLCGVFLNGKRYKKGLPFNTARFSAQVLKSKLKNCR